MSLPVEEPNECTVWMLCYPTGRGTQRYVGPFPTKKAAYDFPVDSEVCSVTPVFTPDQDLEN